MTTMRKTTPEGMTPVDLQRMTGPGEPLEELRARQEADAEWAARAFAGKAALGPAIRIQRGRPRTGEATPPTIVKAIRLPVPLLRLLQGKAETLGLSVNALLQMAAAEYLARH